MTELFSFNDLLFAGGVEPAGVMLLRHTGRNLPLLDIWRADRALIEAYQAHQRAGDGFRRHGGMRHRGRSF